MKNPNPGTLVSIVSLLVTLAVVGIDKRGQEILDYEATEVQELEEEEEEVGEGEEFSSLMVDDFQGTQQIQGSEGNGSLTLHGARSATSSGDDGTAEEGGTDRQGAAAEEDDYYSDFYDDEEEEESEAVRISDCKHFPFSFWLWVLVLMTYYGASYPFVAVARCVLESPPNTHPHLSLAIGYTTSGDSTRRKPAALRLSSRSPQCSRPPLSVSLLIVTAASVLPV
jgi:hypothetical protein